MPKLALLDALSAAKWQFLTADRGPIMTKAGALLLLVVASSLSAPVLMATPAKAGGTCASFILSCENGRSYSFCPIATSDAGEVVTGHLALSPRRGLHMRLVPMGVGYRYIGRNVWFEGVRSEAILHFGNDYGIACSVTEE